LVAYKLQSVEMPLDDKLIPLSQISSLQMVQKI